MKFALNSMLICVAILTIGCSSVGEVRQRIAELSLDSKKDAKTVASCISDRYTKKHTHFVNKISTQLVSNGYGVSHEMMMGYWGHTTLVYFEALDKQGGGSQLKIYFPSDRTQAFVRITEQTIDGCY